MVILPSRGSLELKFGSEEKRQRILFFVGTQNVGQRRSDKTQQLGGQREANARDLQHRHSIQFADEVEFEQLLRQTAQQAVDEPHQVAQHLRLFIFQIAVDSPHDENHRSHFPVNVRERDDREDESD